MNLLKKCNKNQTGNQKLPELNFQNFQKFMGCNKSSSKREDPIYTGPPKKEGKFQINNKSLQVKEIRSEQK